MAKSDNYEIPESGAVFTFGRSGFADNLSSHFFVRNDSVLELSCGDEHTALICKSGRVFLFGKNDYGQLGFGHTKIVNKPSCLKYLKPFHSVHVACGKSHTIISTACCKLFTFGCNSDGQLGIGDQEDRPMPQLVTTGLAEDDTIVMVSAGCHHSGFLTGKGELYLWGNNADGQCSGNLKQYLTPYKVEFSQPITSVSCGYYHTGFISNGQVYTFGEEDNGKLGRPNTIANNIPEKVQIEESCLYVKCGGSHTIVQTESGEAYAFGSNFSGQLGIGSFEPEFVVPQVVKFPEENAGLFYISCGESHSAFLMSNGVLYTCGDARHGKLCNENESTNLIFPTAVKMFNNYFCTFVSCGGCHTMVLSKIKDSKRDETLLPPLKVLNTVVQPDELTEETKESEYESPEFFVNSDEHEEWDSKSNAETIINSETAHKESIYQEIQEIDIEFTEQNNFKEDSDKTLKETETDMVVFPKRNSFKRFFSKVKKIKSDSKILTPDKSETIQEENITNSGNQTSSKACLIL